MQVVERPPNSKLQKKKEKKPADLDLLGLHACNSIGGAVNTKGMLVNRRSKSLLTEVSAAALLLLLLHYE